MGIHLHDGGKMVGFGSMFRCKSFSKVFSCGSNFTRLFPVLLGSILSFTLFLKVGDFLQAALCIDVDSIAGVNFHKFFQRLILLILDGRWLALGQQHWMLLHVSNEHIQHTINIGSRLFGTGACRHFTMYFIPLLTKLRFYTRREFYRREFSCLQAAI